MTNAEERMYYERSVRLEEKTANMANIGFKTMAECILNDLTESEDDINMPELVKSLKELIEAYEDIIEESRRDINYARERLEALEERADEGGADTE